MKVTCIQAKTQAIHELVFSFLRGKTLLKLHSQAFVPSEFEGNIWIKAGEFLKVEKMANII